MGRPQQDEDWGEHHDDWSDYQPGSTIGWRRPDCAPPPPLPPPAAGAPPPLSVGLASSPGNISASAFVSYVSVGFGATVALIAISLCIMLLLRRGRRRPCCSLAAGALSWRPCSPHFAWCANLPHRTRPLPPPARRHRRQQQAERQQAEADARRRRVEEVQRMIEEKRRRAAGARKPYLVVHPGGARSCVQPGFSGWMWGARLLGS